MENIGQYLKKVRCIRGETLHQVSKGVDIDSPMLSKIERGTRLPTIDQIKRISLFFSLVETDLLVMLIAEKIIKEFGLNKMTYLAIKSIENEFDLSNK